MTSTEPTSADAEDSTVSTSTAERGDLAREDGARGHDLREDVVGEHRAEETALDEGLALVAESETVARHLDDSEDRTGDGPDPDAADENPLEIESEVAADYLEELLDIADLDGDIDTYVDGDRAHVSIVSGSTTLVGKDGEVLDALQELTRLAVMAETGQRSRLMLDVAGFRAKRRTELVALAGDAVEEVRASAEPVHLNAMNPFERKIVHDAVAAAGLTSESEGEDPRRHVVVLPTRD